MMQTIKIMTIKWDVEYFMLRVYKFFFIWLEIWKLLFSGMIWIVCCMLSFFIVKVTSTNLTTSSPLIHALVHSIAIVPWFLAGLIFLPLYRLLNDMRKNLVQGTTNLPLEKWISLLLMLKLWMVRNTFTTFRQSLYATFPTNTQRTWWVW